MSWFRGDDGMDDNRKLLLVGDQAFRLYWIAVPWARRLKTGGRLHQTDVEALAAKHRIRRWQAAVKELTTVPPDHEFPLWEPLGDGLFQIHDFAHYNPPPTSTARVRKHRGQGPSEDDVDGQNVRPPTGPRGGGEGVAVTPEAVTRNADETFHRVSETQGQRFGSVSETSPLFPSPTPPGFPPQTPPSAPPHALPYTPLPTPVPVPGDRAREHATRAHEDTTTEEAISRASEIGMACQELLRRELKGVERAAVMRWSKLSQGVGEVPVPVSAVLAVVDRKMREVTGEGHPPVSLTYADAAVMSLARMPPAGTHLTVANGRPPPVYRASKSEALVAENLRRIRQLEGMP